MRLLILLLLWQSELTLTDRALVQDHQYQQATVAPMALVDIERTALENNREIRVMQERVELALKQRWFQAPQAESQPGSLPGGHLQRSYGLLESSLASHDLDRFTLSFALTGGAYQVTRTAR